MNQSKTTRLMEFLSDKTLSFGCQIIRYHSDNDKNGELGVCLDSTKNKCPHFYRYPENPTYLGENEYKTIGHPITISRVLLALREAGHGGHFVLPSGDIALFTKNLYQDKWEVLATWNLKTNNLQKEIEESGWEDLCEMCYSKGVECNCGGKGSIEQLKNPQTRQLVSFLYELFINNM